MYRYANASSQTAFRSANGLSVDGTESSGYINRVDAKKALIGCESPKARGQEPQHRKGMRLFCSRPIFGGPNGEAQASPVTLRVPRSLTPIRAAAQCESWSAVVHQAQLETIMAQTFNALELAQLRLKLTVDAWETEREQINALVIAIAHGLTPEPDEDAPHWHEWRLAQVACDVLSDARDVQAHRKMVGGTTCQA